MTRVTRTTLLGFLTLGLVAGSAQFAAAQAAHSFHVGAGLFAPRGYDARDSNDVLIENLNTLEFDIKKFRGASVMGEWTVTFNERIEVGLGTGFYQRSVPSFYRDYVNSNGSEIEQDLKLRVVPVTAVVRFLPFGRAGKVQPYVGGGVSALNWRYSESGEFVDFFDGFAVFQDRYVANGTTIGGVALAGVRLPLGGDIYALNTEFRYQFGQGDLGDNGFLTDKIDLSGLHFTVGFQIRF
jgi:outer membrane protein W